jgi:dihydrofolate reductase
VWTPAGPRTGRTIDAQFADVEPSTSVAADTTNQGAEMAKIVMSGPQNVTLDGVVQDPTGAEGFSRGGWFVEFGGKDLEAWNKVALDEALGAEAWLLGRRSYEFFGSLWRPRTGELADRLNSMPKYVVSSTLEHPEWNNSTVLRGDVVTEVSNLKLELDGEIVVPASYQLARTLIAHDLVDELRLAVFPVVLGVGERLFGGASDQKRLRLIDAETIGDGLSFLTYELVRGA